MLKRRERGRVGSIGFDWAGERIGSKMMELVGVIKGCRIPCGEEHHIGVAKDAGEHVQH